jgi:antitoxin (DNA-binding transcriptional repressor) of toxin-antitoxin stability system
MPTFAVHVAEAYLDHLIERALRGEDVIIAGDGQQAVRLVPVDAPKPRRRCGSLKGRLEVPDSFFDPLPEDELKLWEGG